MRTSWTGLKPTVITVMAVVVAFATLAARPMSAQDGTGDAGVTFTRDIAPILQRSCVKCHRPNGVAPMSLVEYDDVQPYARQIMRRTGIRDRMGTMPPWYVEKDIGVFG